ncbi:MAG: type II toxin-antitoxin system HipA family toxin [Gallionellaceae bacterium]|jgi:serine/threonine-protein kinase HipA|nr:type II toxin-antitoxin system HipA family toxin [Gallionellaceae bacterium]
MKLDVHVRGCKVASLYREQDEYVLKYLADAAPADFVSLTMPVRETPWRWPRDLHPFFRQNLPEGYLLDIIREEFGRLLDGTDLSLLAVVGGMGIGRVTITPEGGASVGEMEPLQVEQLLKAENTTEHFFQLVRRYARASISGMVPKFIAPEETLATANQPSGKSTLRTSRHIIKGSDDSTPFLGFNEFYTMRVLERLNVVPVAKTRMSDDGRVLVVDRFDVDENGIPTHGVEDACSLLGLSPHEKYATTTERVLKATRVYVPAANVRAQLQQLGWHLLTNYVVRNADCHAKNIALYYTGLKDVTYTPVYDVVTTQAYPRYAANPPGLSIDGRKNWTPGKTLARFFNSTLGIESKQYAEMVERLCESAVEVGQEIIEAAKNEPRWHGVAKQMLHAWHDGITSLRNPVAIEKMEVAIAQAGFSESEPPESGRNVIGRSELLGG